MILRLVNYVGFNYGNLHLFIIHYCIFVVNYIYEYRLIQK